MITDIVVRPPHAQDSEPISRFVADLSPTSRYRPFSAGIPHPMPDVLEAMTTVAPHRPILLALDGATIVPPARRRHGNHVHA